MKVVRTSPFDRTGLYYYLAVSLKVREGAEIGVWKGDNAITLLEMIPDLKLWLIDPYKHQPKEDYNEGVNVEDSVFEYMYLMVKETFKKYPKTQILRMTSMDALEKISDESLDFVYIDGNHKYEFVKSDIEGWHKKVKSGGIVAGHDFDVRHPGVINAVSRIPDDFANESTVFHTPDNTWWYVKK